MAKGAEAWHNSAPKAWPDEVERFHSCLACFDEYLASDQNLECSYERLFQGAIADSLTHVGQIAMLRRIAGAAMRGENYSKADIQAGRVGPDQPAPRYEFD
jgi:hypothetical protein